VALKSIDALLFPEERRETCPRCGKPLVPTARSVWFGVALFVALAAILVTVVLHLPLPGMPGGMGAGLIAGLLIAFGGILLVTRVMRYQ